jgi:DNA invertase Pin-like site-specific DNA recombinase
MFNLDPQALRRCAIYTRKSTNHLLDREMNSLVTQREMCAAYIASQRYRGWVEVPERYDDGGHSGSGLERPALSRLMHAIEAGEIDTLVVYKIDRLTRSLLDFVRLIELFDQRAISLVSVSQAFDTSDSMGRMILNVLLTFSQFERELIGERVRDSIRTRKRHGRVHGGLAPFGYDYAPTGGLEIVEQEAEMVRFMFSEFLRTERFTAAMTAVRDAGLRSTEKLTKRGTKRGGRQICAGLVYNVLRNPIYVGEIRGHDRTYPGIHEPIITRQTWERAQAIAETRKRKTPHAKGTDHFLAGLLWDDLGRHMNLEIDWHRGTAYYCYASSNAMWSQAEFRRAYRSNADRLENLVIAGVAAFLADRKALRAALKGLGLYGAALDPLVLMGSRAARRLEATPREQMEALFAALAMRIEVGEERLVVDLRTFELRRFLEWSGSGAFRARATDWPCSNARHALEIAACAVSAARWPVINVTRRDPAATGKPDKRLVKLLRDARSARQLLEDRRDLTLEELAGVRGCRPGHFSRLVQLTYLAPDIVTAILDGTHPQGLTSTALRKVNLPMDWAIQRRLLGFPAPTRTVDPRNLFGRGMWGPGMKAPVAGGHASPSL